MALVHSCCFLGDKRVELSMKLHRLYNEFDYAVNEEQKGMIYEELLVINSQLSTFIIQKPLQHFKYINAVKKLDLTLMNNTLCYDVIWYIKQFLGDTYFKYLLNVKIGEDFRDGINNIFYNWSRNQKRVFLIHNLVNKDDWFDAEDRTALTWWIFKRKSEDLSDILYAMLHKNIFRLRYRWNRTIHFNKTKRKVVLKSMRYFRSWFLTHTDTAVRKEIKRLKDNWDGEGKL